MPHISPSMGPIARPATMTGKCMGENKRKMGCPPRLRNTVTITMPKAIMSPVSVMDLVFFICFILLGCSWTPCKVYAKEKEGARKMHREYVSLHKNKDEKMWMVYDGKGDERD